ncbi:hypothetical protein D3C81_1994040 [compost metagenome]
MRKCSRRKGGGTLEEYPPVPGFYYDAPENSTSFPGAVFSMDDFRHRAGYHHRSACARHAIVF